MPPIRRYVRISPYSCLEVRIFLDNPADASTWLLRSTNPALPRVFKAVKPLILPKLREENERTRLAKAKSGKKKKGVKDVVKGDDFEVVVFLTEGQGRHEVVVKRREARQAKMTGGAGARKDEPMVIREEDEEEMDINDVPAAGEDGDDDLEDTSRTRQRNDDTKDPHDDEIDQFEDEKKKLGFKTQYDGFHIWGKVLCLLIERKGGPGRKNATSQGTASTGLLLTGSKDGRSEEGVQQALMQEWISTQVPQDEEDTG